MAVATLVATLNCAYCLELLRDQIAITGPAPTIERGAIAIALAAPPPHTPRGFLHWRLPDDGHRACGQLLRAVIRNPSHDRTSPN